MTVIITMNMVITTTVIIPNNINNNTIKNNTYKNDNDNNNDNKNIKGPYLSLSAHTVANYIHIGENVNVYSINKFPHIILTKIH